MKLKPPNTSAYASSHRNWNRNVATSDAQSMPFQPWQHAAQRLDDPVGERDDRLPERIAERRAQQLHDEAQQQRVREQPEHDVEQIADCLVGHDCRRNASLGPSASPSSRARAAAAFTAATNFAFTPSASISAIARSVVPPFDVTCARRMPGSRSDACASLIAPANVAYASLRASSRAKPSSRAACSSAFEKVEHVGGAAAGHAGHGVEHVLALDPQHRARRLEHARGELAARRVAPRARAKAPLMPAPTSAGVLGIARTIRA